MTLVRALVISVVAGLLAGDRSLRAQSPIPPTPLPSAEPLWHMPGNALGTPVHDDEQVYFLSRDREVLALDRNDGSLRWKTGTGVTSTDGIFGNSTAGTSLAIDGPMVIAGDWDVVGVERRTGRRRWTYTAPDGDGPGLFLGPALDGTVYAGSVAGRVYAFDSLSGALRWTTALFDGMVSVYAPVVSGDSVYVAFTRFDPPPVGGGGVARVERTTGRLVWVSLFPKTPANAQGADRGGGPVVVDDLVFATAQDGHIRAYDTSTGAMRWSVGPLADPFPGLLTPPGALPPELDVRTLVRAGRHLVAGSTTGTIVAYDVDSQQEAWRYNGGYLGSSAFQFAVDDTTVYVPFLSGLIVALDSATGHERWRYGDYRLGFLYAPDPVGDRVYAAASQAGYHALAPLARKAQP